MRELDWQCLERNQQWDRPHLAHQPNQESLIDFLGKPGPELELEDEEHGGGDHEQVGVEC